MVPERWFNERSEVKDETNELQNIVGNFIGDAGICGRIRTCADKEETGASEENDGHETGAE